MTSISEKIIKPKLGVLELAKQLGNVSKACKLMGYSRDTFYRYKELYEMGGEEALQEISRKKPIEKNRVPDYIEDAVVKLAVENPALGQHRASNELLQRGIIVSSSGVRSVWLRNGLETFKKRLKALEVKSATEGIILTEEQLQCLEKATLEKEAHGEIVTEHPGYLGSQDTYFVGTMKGVGRIYQQTFIDTYSRVAFARLYTEKTAITAAHALNENVLPWFSEQGVPLLRILTDRGTEYCGRVEEHAFQLFLAVEDIDHSKTKARSPQTNGICERFHRTMKEEFYDITFRKKLYHSLEALQQDADNWLEKYNGLRPHSGKHCYGKTPLQTFNETKPLALEKKLDQSFEPEENIQELGELNNASTDALLQRASIAPSTGLIEEPMLQGAKRTKLEMSSYLDDGQSVQ
jgi:Winged helix-turn helix/Integrase core domain